MTKISKQNWERLPDDRKFVEVYRNRLPQGWLVYAMAYGGQPRFGSYLYYSDPQHNWQPLEEDGVVGPRRYLRWDKFKERPEGIVTRLKVPDGWILFVDYEKTDSNAQIIFCPDPDHIWN